jgi:hypothetical protein
VTGRAAELEAEFFNHYPPEDTYDDAEEINKRLNAMLIAVKGMRAEAIEKKSIAILEAAQRMDAELTALYGMLSQRHAQRLVKSGLIAAPTSVPLDPNSAAWKR